MDDSKTTEAPEAPEARADTLAQGVYNIAFIFTCASPTCKHVQAVTDPSLVMTAIKQSARFLTRCQKCDVEQCLSPSWAQQEQPRLVTPHGQLDKRAVDRFKRAMRR